MQFLFVLFMIVLTIIEIINIKEKSMNNILPFFLLVIFATSFGTYFSINPFGKSLAFGILKLLGVKY